MTAPDATIAFDYHSHNRRCGHAAGEMGDYVAQAHALGLTEFGVSDHNPAYFLTGDHANPSTQMACSALPGYVAEAWAVKREWAGRITVRVGVEADFIEGRENDLRALLDLHPFEYALGSVHYTLGRSIFDRSRWADQNPADVFADYYRLVALAARSGLFDTLSHLTAVEAYSPPIDPALAARLYPPVADAVAEGGCIVEINTSGYRKMGGDEPFPNRQMLRLLVERGVPLTFGSDCHRPLEVGYGAERVKAILAELGLDADAAPRPVTVRRGPLLTFQNAAVRSE